MTSNNVTTARRRRPRRRVWLILALLALAALGAIWWWQARGNAAADPTATPQTSEVTLSTYRVTVAGPGSLVAARSLDVAGPVDLSGTIASIVAVGDRVSAGQTLVRLDPSPFERAVRDAEFALERAQSQLTGLDANQADSSGSARQATAEAEARVNTAQRAVERNEAELTLARRLRELGTESVDALQAAQDAYDDAAAELAAAQSALVRLRNSQELQSNVGVQDRRNAELTVAQAELELDDARANLASLNVTAPFAGVVSQVLVTEGSSVSSQQVLLTLIDDATLDLPVQVDETQIGRVAVGQAARLRLDAIPGRTFEGVVSAIAPVARIESNIPIFDVTVTLSNEDLRVRPGMTAEADIVVREVEAAATVPTAALSTRDGGSVVMVRAADGSITPRSVTVVDTVGFNSIVEGDLADGDEVVVPSATPGERPGTRGPGGPPVGVAVPAGRPF